MRKCDVKLLIQYYHFQSRNLAGNELEELPTFLSFLPLLESIDVSANRLTKIEANSLEENKNLQIM